MSVMVVGSIALDTIRMQGNKEYKNVPGGSCTYFIHSAHFFSPIRVVGVVGDDFPKKYLDGFKKCKADLAGLQILKGEKTFQWHGTYMKDMNNRVTDALHFGVLGSFDPILPEKFRSTKTVFLACSQPALQLKVLDQMTGNPLAICDTIEIYIKENRRDLDKVMKRCQGMVVNESEIKLIAEEDNIVAATLATQKKYKLEFLVVKKGEHGGLLAYKNQIHPFPAYPLAKVVDPTGAGDCFAGGFVASLDKAGKVNLGTLKKAVVNATAVASFVCEGVALTSLSKLTAAQLKARATAFSKMASLA